MVAPSTLIPSIGQQANMTATAFRADEAFRPPQMIFQPLLLCARAGVYKDKQLIRCLRSRHSAPPPGKRTLGRQLASLQQVLGAAPLVSPFSIHGSFHLSFISSRASRHWGKKIARKDPTHSRLVPYSSRMANVLPRTWGKFSRKKQKAGYIRPGRAQ